MSTTKIGTGGSNGFPSALQALHEAVLPDLTKNSSGSLSPSSKTKAAPSGRPVTSSVASFVPSQVELSAPGGVNSAIKKLANHFYVRDQKELICLTNLVRLAATSRGPAAEQARQTLVDYLSAVQSRTRALAAANPDGIRRAADVLRLQINAADGLFPRQPVPAAQRPWV
jgi:hypothetical protein